MLRCDSSVSVLCQCCVSVVLRCDSVVLKCDSGVLRCDSGVLRCDSVVLRCDSIVVGVTGHSHSTVTYVTLGHS